MKHPLVDRFYRKIWRVISDRGADPLEAHQEHLGGEEWYQEQTLVSGSIVPPHEVFPVDGEYRGVPYNLPEAVASLMHFLIY